MNPGGLRADLLYATSSAGEAPASGHLRRGRRRPAVRQHPVHADPHRRAARAGARGAVPAGRLVAAVPRSSASPRASAYAPTGPRPRGSRISNLTLNGAPVGPTQTYRVVTNSFLAAGGDNFRTLAAGTDRRDTGRTDLDALVAYFRASQPGHAGQDRPAPVAESLPAPPPSATATATASDRRDAADGYADADRDGDRPTPRRAFVRLTPTTARRDPRRQRVTADGPAVTRAPPSGLRLHPAQHRRTASCGEGCRRRRRPSLRAGPPRNTRFSVVRTDCPAGRRAVSAVLSRPQRRQHQRRPRRAPAVRLRRAGSSRPARARR